jgi:hypothetical protein
VRTAPCLARFWGSFVRRVAGFTTWPSPLCPGFLLPLAFLQRMQVGSRGGNPAQKYRYVVARNKSSTFTFAELAREVRRRSLSLSRACRMHPLLFFLVAHKAASTISSGPAGQPSSLSGADAIDQTARAPFPPFVIPVVPAQGHGNTRCSLQLPSSNPAPIGGGISTTRLSSPSHPRFRERLPRI